ncbi:MAG: biotin-dependent carboxyltransferase family protein [Devosia sp.]
MTTLTVKRAAPLTTLQDGGRFNMLGHGISASGPMDRGAYETAGQMLGAAGETAIEFTAAGIDFTADGALSAACTGGAFMLRVNGQARQWPASMDLQAEDLVEIAPGPIGNYGYLRFDREVTIAPVLGSRSTNLTVGLGGLDGRALRAGDRLELSEFSHASSPSTPGAETDQTVRRRATPRGQIRVIWGMHADRLPREMRERFQDAAFTVSPRLDRMGVQLEDPAGVFRGLQQLSLVSDAIVPGDIQILGNGTPTVLMRDHQPTGGYPRIATIVSADLDRFAQMRPGTEVRFQPVSLENLP